jgi:hypothetical protein
MPRVQPLRRGSRGRDHAAPLPTPARSHKVAEKLFTAQTEIFEREGWIIRGGSIIDATIIAAPSSTKNASGTRDPEMHQTKKGRMPACPQ